MVSLDQANNFPKNIADFKVKDTVNELDILTNNMGIGKVCKTTVYVEFNELGDVFLSTAESTFGLSGRENNCENKCNKPWSLV